MFLLISVYENNMCFPASPESLAFGQCIVLKRLLRLIDLVQSKKKGLLANDPRRSEVFFDLRDFPELSVEELSQTILSQSSTSSRLSERSDLEIEIPSKQREKQMAMKKL